MHVALAELGSLILVIIFVTMLPQVVLWSLGDHVTSLSNHAQGTFDGKREQLSSRLTLKVYSPIWCMCKADWFDTLLAVALAS